MVDFFTVPTVTFRILFCFIVLRHHRRMVVHFNVTAHPTAQWTAQQTVEAFPDDEAPRFLIRDRDSIYGDFFRQRLKHMGIEEIVTAPRSPWQNPYVERLTGSITHECIRQLSTRNAHLHPDGVFRKHTPARIWAIWRISQRLPAKALEQVLFCRSVGKSISS